MKRGFKYSFALILCLTLCSAFTLHKFYVSITEVEYNNDSKCMEVSIKLIGHDLEKALKISGVPDLRLGTPQEHKQANAYLLKYVNKKFSVLNNNTAIKFNFIGKNVTNDDFVYCYLKSDPITAIHSLTFKNSLLTEVFEDQANILYYKNGSEKLDYRFNKQKTSIKKQ
jgi:hypothetical protein